MVAKKGNPLRMEGYSGVLKQHWDGNGSLEELWTTKRDCHLLACLEYKRYGFLCKLEIYYQQIERFDVKTDRWWPVGQE